MTRTITPQRLRSLRLPRALLDVREPPEADAGHIPGATNLSLGDFELRVTAVVPRTDVPVVSYDGDDGRARVAAAMLVRLGFADTRVLGGGIDAWRTSGGTVERGRNVPSKRFGEEVLTEDEGLFVEPDELHERLRGADPPVVLDVRTPAEHGREHVPGAVNSPGFDVLAAAEALAGRNRPIVVHCTGRTRGIIAARTLRLAGFPQVHALQDGTMGWLLAGLAVERGSGPAPPPTGLSDEATRQRLQALALASGVRTMDVHTAARLLQNRPLEATYAFDVRPAGQPGSADGFVRVPSGQLIQQLDDHVAVQGSGVVVASEDDARSAAVGYWLRRLGVPDVAVIQGGVPAWRAAGLPWRDEPAPPAALAAAAASVQLVEPADAAALVGEAVLVSVDPSPCYRLARVPGASWVQRSWLELQAGARWPDRAVALLLTCADGLRSTLAGAALVRQGYEDVRVLAGGVRAWRKSGRSVESGDEGLPLEPGDVLRHPLELGERAMRAYLDWEVDLAVRSGRDL